MKRFSVPEDLGKNHHGRREVQDLSQAGALQKEMQYD
jgi:hypothetical protein